ncbi:MAG: flagellar export protein FliJ [candidate division Zixibacteria bacterium HGW-Zixibacteria-1]|nr:MAG: flagellar export protein FliJ [candidate division Zixibacteria bacterium HGW-Zixibacteria-1]
MKKFRFRLERLLQLKAHIEKEKQKTLGRAAQKVIEKESELRGLDNTRRDIQSSQRHKLNGAVNIANLSVYSRYYVLLKKKEMGGKELLKAYLKDQEKRRLELVEATKEKKIYEKLKERKFDIYRREVGLATQKEQDEIASQTLLHKKRSSRKLSGASG